MPKLFPSSALTKAGFPNNRITSLSNCGKATHNTALSWAKRMPERPAPSVAILASFVFYRWLRSML